MKWREIKVEKKLRRWKWKRRTEGEAGIGEWMQQHKEWFECWNDGDIYSVAINVTMIHTRITVIIQLIIATPLTESRKNCKTIWLNQFWSMSCNRREISIHFFFLDNFIFIASYYVFDTFTQIETKCVMNYSSINESSFFRYPVGQPLFKKKWKKKLQNTLSSVINNNQ